MSKESASLSSGNKKKLEVFFFFSFFLHFSWSSYLIAGLICNIFPYVVHLAGSGI